MNKIFKEKTTNIKKEYKLIKIIIIINNNNKVNNSYYQSPYPNYKRQKVIKI